MCKSKMAVDAAQPTSSPRPTSEPTRTTQTRPAFTSSSSSSSGPTSSTSNTSYKLSSTASTSSQTSLGSFRLSLPENPNLYDFSEIRAATNNFLAKRLSSSSSPSWRCTLRGKDTVVFQRKFRRKLPTQELKNRLSMLCRSHHTSIIKLLGASVSGDNLFLVYEFVPNCASLASCLRNKNNPGFTVLSTWMSRMQVAADLAQGLDYVHNNTGLDVTIVHNRIKSSSVLVTEPNCNARICHFGTAQLCGEADFHPISKTKSKSGGSGEIIEVGEEMGRSQNSKSGTQFEGQRGYMSPEFQTSGVATQKSDVYAFGVVILELLSGQEPLKYKFDKSRGDFISTTVLDSAQAAVAGGGLRTWVDSRLKDSFPVEVAEKVTRVALDCVHVDPDMRPGMGRVAGKISKFYLESRTWSEKFRVPTGISVSLGPR